MSTPAAPGPNSALGAEMWLWARMLPFLCPKTKAFGDILRLSTAGPSRRYRGIPVDEIARRAKHASRHPWLMRDRRCLREGILAFRFLTLADIPAKIHFAVDRSSIDAPVLAAHCWVTVADKPIINPPTPSMVTIFVRDNKLADARW